MSEITLLLSEAGFGELDPLGTGSDADNSVAVLIRLTPVSVELELLLDGVSPVV